MGQSQGSWVKVRGQVSRRMRCSERSRFLVRSQGSGVKCHQSLFMSGFSDCTTSTLQGARSFESNFLSESELTMTGQNHRQISPLFMVRTHTCKRWNHFDVWFDFKPQVYDSVINLLLFRLILSTLFKNSIYKKKRPLDRLFIYRENAHIFKTTTKKINAVHILITISIFSTNKIYMERFSPPSPIKDKVCISSRRFFMIFD